MNPGPDIAIEQAKMSQTEENERLHEVMKAMAKVRDQATRKRMYRQLLRAHFYIPITPEAEGAEGGLPWGL